MTREEAIQHFKEQLDIFGGEHAEAIKVAIEALKNKSRPFGDCSKCMHTYGTLGCCTTVSNEWVYDCEHGMEQYKNTKAEPSEDGTLEVKVEDATKIGRVLISDDKHRGGLYYPDEYEPQGVSFENDIKIKSCSKDSDLISRRAVIDALYDKGSSMTAWGELLAMKWSDIQKCIEQLPSADRPTDGDLISRADAIEALGEEPLVWCDEEYEIAERYQWRTDIEAIKSVPSADRPRGEWIHTPNGIDRDFVWWTCSECGHKIFSETEKDRREFHAYCGRCGADMRGDTK